MCNCEATGNAYVGEVRRGKSVAIVQSNYIPWKGYFDLIGSVDEFVLYDDVQFTKNDWRNRNRIKTPQGLLWLSVPVGARIDRLIRDVTIDSRAWQRLHWKSLESNYKRAPCFRQTAEWLAPLYQERYTKLSDVNTKFIRAVCLQLNIGTRISSSGDYGLSGERSERLAELCVHAGATEYVSGPSAKSYLRLEPFRERGVSVRWFDYEGYPSYPQLWGSFVHEVSVLDLLFNCGAEAPRFMKLKGKAVSR